MMNKKNFFRRFIGGLFQPCYSGEPASNVGNAFNFLRLIAAYAVLFSHSYRIYGLREPRPVGGYTLGALAVFVFFAISGFLVCQSWCRDNNSLRFALRRGLRIFPGLLVVVIFTTLLLGPLVSTLALRDYFYNRDTWVYFLNNSLMIAGDSPLPGVFYENPDSNVVNGSLWTLRYEVLMYFLLALIGRFVAVLRLPLICLLIFVASAISFIGISMQGMEHWTLPLPIVWRFGLFFDTVEILRLGGFFFSGCCLYLYRNRLPMSFILALGLGLLVLLSPNKTVSTCLLWLAIPYVTIFAAFRLPLAFNKLGQKGDISYGIYIYAFPIQQFVASIFLPAGVDWVYALLVSSLLSIGLAMLSWHFIESPALGLKALLVSKPVGKFDK